MVALAARTGGASDRTNFRRRDALRQSAQISAAQVAGRVPVGRDLRQAGSQELDDDCAGRLSGRQAELDPTRSLLQFRAVLSADCLPVSRTPAAIPLLVRA